MQVILRNDVDGLGKRGDIVDVVAEVGDACDYAAVKKCTRAGAGCGGCEQVCAALVEQASPRRAVVETR